MTAPQPSVTNQGSPPADWIALPADLVRCLGAFRGRVRRIKFFEAACAALCGIAVAFLAVFVCDRLGETPALLRLAILLAAVAACLVVPLAVRRWGFGLQSLEQVARLIERRFPAAGDELLGIIDIVRSGWADRTKSRPLCEAAVAQVAERAERIDFREATPPARLWQWALAAALPAAVAAALAVLVPDAAANAWRRLARPFAAVERFTFARVAPLGDRVVVPHGEPVTVAAALRDDTQWRPDEATLRVGRQPPLAARLEGDRYSFALPPQVADGPLTLAVGDARQQVRLEAVHRPELAGLEADVVMPDYMQRPGARRQDIRGGMLAPVKGSRVSVVATVNRDLAAATVDGAAIAPDGRTIRTPATLVEADSTIRLAWRDADGLAAAEPLELSVTARGDEPPTVVLLDVPPTRGILLETDTLKFKVAARDDFGIRRVGIEWEGLDDPYATAAAAADPAAREKGERVLQAGGGEVESLDAAATFCPDALGIRPQPIAIRGFAEDYLPGRSRAVSTPVVLYVLDRAEHALVLNTRLQQFRQQASEVRDREMSLLATNKELRRLPAEQLLAAESRARLESQAAAEETNARRLERLVDDGADLVREALKNPEFEPQTLEELATDIQTLAEIAERRMPGVADLLAQAAAARPASGTPQRGKEQPAKPSGGDGQPDARPSGGQPESAETADGRKPAGDAPRAGEEREQPGGSTPDGGAETPAGQPPIPQVVDTESSQQPKPTAPKSSPPGGGGRFGLPTTQAGVAPPQPAGEQEEPQAEEALDEAIARQEELLAEFAKVADELAAVMARLEGSTFVKRLKLASREQMGIGNRIAGLAAEAFGTPERRSEPVAKALGDVREQSLRETDKLSALMDDLQAYFDRRQLPAFRTVLEEMKELDTLGSLRQLSDDVLKEAGMSIAQAEFWSDTFDRLADDLVPPPQGGGGQGNGPPRDSVPPEVVLEAMKILEDEVNLREETRVAEQAKAAVAAEAFAMQAEKLADRQDALADRIVDLVERLLEEPEGERQFAAEIQLFEKVEEVMAEATDILATPETGATAIAAETEVVELLLAAQAAAANPPGGGGGGGSGVNPGGGGTGTATSAALALVGRGTRGGRGAGGEKDQATGTSGRVLPEEFRAGLDAYFNTFEKERRR
ncbi:MAG: hypothetical protein ACKO4T_07765 [Planctomycetaceae bacterium]